MKTSKNELNGALRVLGKIVCQTSPVELYRSIRFAAQFCHKPSKNPFFHLHTPFSFDFCFIKEYISIAFGNTSLGDRAV